MRTNTYAHHTQIIWYRTIILIVHFGNPKEMPKKNCVRSPWQRERLCKEQAHKHTLINNTEHGYTRRKKKGGGGGHKREEGVPTPGSGEVREIALRHQGQQRAPSRRARILGPLSQQHERLRPNTKRQKFKSTHSRLVQHKA